MNHTILRDEKLFTTPSMFPIYYAPRPALLSFISDSNLSLAAPILAYWAYSSFFFLLDVSRWKWLDRYRLHESAEVQSRNKATAWDVIKAVLLQQFLQTVLGYYWMEDMDAETTVNHTEAMQSLSETLSSVLRNALGPLVANKLLAEHGGSLVYTLYWWAIPAFQFLVALFVMDTWQYFFHRFFHTNKFLYKHFHSVHHRLYVPYAFGALYNHWFEGLLLDTLGAVISLSAAQLTARQGIALFTFSTLKTVDDHCGYSLPFDPFQWLFPNNAAYHDVHHQAWGIKYNFSQPFYVHWDTLLKTRSNSKRKEKHE